MAPIIKPPKLTYNTAHKRSASSALSPPANIRNKFSPLMDLKDTDNDQSDNIEIDTPEVSWVRRAGDKMQLLSFGHHVYSTDQRYELLFKDPNDWQLRISYLNERDGGHYECQVSTHPPIAFTVYLAIIVPQLEITDERGVQVKDKFYYVGSTIELKCYITKVPQPSQFIVWRHETTSLNYDTSRGGISVKTDILTNGAKSRLFIANAQTSDSGKYTCSLTDIASTSVTVHVLNGETPAAMQHGGSNRCGRLHSLWVIITFAWILFRLS